MAEGKVLDLKQIASNGDLNKITIMENGASENIVLAVGFLKESFGLSLKSAYSTLLSMDSFATLKTMMGIAGINIFNQGIFTKKFFTGGESYILLKPDFRVVDWDDNGMVLSVASNLVKASLPSAIAGIDDENRYTSINDNTAKLTTKINELQNAQNINNTGAILTIGSNLANVAIDFFKSVRITGRPPLVKIKIGSYFYCSNMIVEDVNFTFSKEITANGNPLYGDFIVSLSSEEIPTAGQVNNMLKQGRAGGINPDNIIIDGQ